MGKTEGGQSVEPAINIPAGEKKETVSSGFFSFVERKKK